MRDKTMSSRGCDSDPELERARDNRLKLSRTATASDVVKAPVVELPRIHVQVEVKVENPISNANDEQSSGGEKDGRRLRLLKAILRGDLNAAERVLRSDESAAHLLINIRGDTPLHVAALAKQTAIAHMLVKYLEERELVFKNGSGITAFFFAAASGDVEIAKVMYDKNKTLPTIRNEGMIPIAMAAKMGNKKMVEYLHKITPLQDFTAEEFMHILVGTIHIEMYDIALDILKADHRSIVTSPNVVGGPKDTRGIALQRLALKPFSYYGTSQEWISENLGRYVPRFKRINGSIQKRRQAGQLVKELCKQILTLEDKEISKVFTPLVTFAAKNGNSEFLTLLTQSYPDIIWRKLSKNHVSIFHLAVINRQEKVFSLIYNAGAVVDELLLGMDGKHNSILHLAAKLAPASRLNSVSGAALQMQRELLWFKEVEKIIQPSYVQKKNKEGKTPRELFTKEHEKLRKAGEKWMKDTTTSCMVVATLIATVAFAAAFTVPGGNQEETGVPIFLNNMWFTVFIISDAVAMFSSTASIMMFLSILTSLYREDDFLYTLPAKLMVGLITLFASIVCMILTFSATFFLVYKEENEGTLPKIVAGLALLPITLYLMLNCKLWISLIHSTIWASRYMFRPGKHRLF